MAERGIPRNPRWIRTVCNAEICVNDIRKMRSGRKELAETQQEKDSLRKLLDDERKTMADLSAKIKEFEKKDKTVKDLAEERDALLAERISWKKQRDELEQRVAAFDEKERTLKDIRDENTKLRTDIEKESEQKEKTLTNLQNSIKECEEKIVSYNKMTASNDELTKQAEECRGKTDALQLRIKELEEKEKKAPSLDQSLAGITQERDTLSKMLGQERKKAEDLLIRIKELEKTEEVIAQMSQEKEQLIRQIDEGTAPTISGLLRRADSTSPILTTSGRTGTEGRRKWASAFTCCQPGAGGLRV